MKICLVLMFVGFCYVLAEVPANAQTGLICGDPRDAGCRPQWSGFQPHDLAFLTGRAALGTGTRHESFEFYAVILSSVKAAAPNRRGCLVISEAKRSAAQKLFPGHKVFAAHNRCVDNVISYEGTDPEFNFLAVYGGETREAAEPVLTRAKKRFPQANIRRLRVILDFADE